MATITAPVKFVYCPKCKELRIKPWYSTRPRCSRCRDNGRELKVPRTPLTFVAYALVVAILVLIYLYTRTDEAIYMYGGVVALVACFIVQAMDISRGERVARSRIKTARSDVEAFKKKGWL